jgi:hypothetical protein
MKPLLAAVVSSAIALKGIGIFGKRITATQWKNFKNGMDLGQRGSA